MKSKAELIPQLLDMIKTECANEEQFKITKKDDFTSWCILSSKHGQGEYALDKIRSLIAEKGWKEGYDNKYTGYFFKTYITLIHNHVTDKLNISFFRTGIGGSVFKRRFFPFRNDQNIFCWNKDKMWVFCPITKRPRWFTTMTARNSNITRSIFDLVTGCTIEHHSYILGYHNIIAANGNLYGALTHKYGKFPKRLLALNQNLDLILKIVKKNELNKICQTMVDFEPTEIYGYVGQLLAVAMGIDINEYWLIQDWANDHKVLGKKISLKINSINRIRDEHRKLSRKIMTKQIGPIKVHKKFMKVKDLFENVPFKWELIEDRIRLMNESDTMEHCVATYGPRINSGGCCIVHIEDETGIGYTLEIGSDFNIHQFKGVRNIDAPEKLVLQVKQALRPMVKNQTFEEELVF
jgi:hypothetical protein